MENDEPPKDESETSKNSTAPLDTELDVSSEQFNPLRALNTDDFQITKRKPKVIYQNFAALESAINRVGIWNLNKPTAPIHKSSTKVHEENLERRFLPHQMTIKTTVEQKAIVDQRHNRNLFTNMEKTQGPMAQLQKWRLSGQRIIALVRNERGICGSIEGELEAFDKQWNIVMVNVLETWTRRKHKYGVNKLSGLPAPEDCSQRLNNLGINLPNMKIKSLNRKNVQITRQIPKLFLIGQQIALIKLCKNKEI